ncbi:hemolysin family protein [Desulfocurvus vexinensis]|uniref:hemolysin family protein n=1 Tax=Desulfocurvus vexinensis TaxID=399548 RepID=UPI00048B8214|nr:hemolysin family protein [Desulfocurvus vexinensis]
MDDDSGSLFSALMGKLFRKGDDSEVERFILEAQRDGELRGEESAMLLNVLRLSRRQVTEIMIPRTDIVCAPVDSSIEEMSLLIAESGHSRIPVYRKNRDNMVGIVHAKDVLRAFAQTGDTAPPTLAQIMRAPLFIPETKNVYDMLQVFRTNKIHLAIALDEYGGTSGLVTFEDVLEEIVGEIEDEYDTPRPEDIQALEDGSTLVSGRTPLEELDERLGLALTSTQVETVSGFLCELAGRVPEPQESFTIDGHTLTVKEADAKQIHWILVRPTGGGPGRDG